MKAIKQYRANRNGNISYHTTLQHALAETKYSYSGNGTITTFTAPVFGQEGWGHDSCAILQDREYVKGKRVNYFG